MLMTCAGAARRGRALVLAALVALSAVLFTAGPAQAHTALKESSPADGATVPSPSRIVLTFTDSVIVPQVVVTDASGARRQSGPAKASGNKVTQPIEGTLEPGAYKVGWRVVATDGHPVTGAYEFTVEGTPSASGTPAQPAPQVSSPVTPAGSQGGGSNGWLWIGLAVVAVALVAVVVGLVRRRGAAG